MINIFCLAAAITIFDFWYSMRCYPEVEEIVFQERKNNNKNEVLHFLFGLRHA